MFVSGHGEDHILIEIQEIQRVIDAPKSNISQAVWSIVASAIWMATSTSTIYGSQRLESKIQYQSSSLVFSPELSVRILGLSCGFKARVQSAKFVFLHHFFTSFQSLHTS